MAPIVPTLQPSGPNQTAAGTTRRSDNTTLHPAAIRLRRDPTLRPAAAIRRPLAATRRPAAAVPLPAVLQVAAEGPAVVAAEVRMAVAAVLILAINLAM